MPFRITEQAANEIRLSNHAALGQGQHLRVAAKRKTDGSIGYAMGFDEPAETDTISTQHDVQILIGLASADLLAGAVLDYTKPDDDESDQFIFLNPNDPGFVSPDGQR
ncbi:MAG: hypothetical protein QGI35_06475 [Arenicellales bacterium]|jgi:iron-sulfur cluster assembly protein|nr:hypothetical protein [Acidiferrobacteraceae bacterium]MDP6136658.1 hypothetical protein [Arenicellales bacterium]MDP6392619.1 hypothetical protein [Arenicellales bacterium]HCF72793.1 hypothetical protein [Gammaproteobacteria bacterium]HJP09077.1 hypothetical protein [Arenicellales bacterium]|tara:strand:- start:6353 stop:6676 length:324 start_codon:yes stop_codon:yes gene_type:complete